MSNQTKTYDVAIIGASVAGCSAAILFARKGLRVALIERNPDINAYKKVCTHYIQATATPVLRKLGVDKAIEAAGGIRNSIDVWTRYGWIKPVPNNQFYGYNIRRQVLDPMLRRQGAATPNVDFLPGTTLRDLIIEDERVVGIRLGERDKPDRELRAHLVVGADGRNSRTAQLAQATAEVTPNNRFIYFAYYRHLPRKTGKRSQMWVLDPGIAYVMPNDDDTTVVAAMLPKSELAEFKQDVPGNFTRFFESIADGPNLGRAEQISEVMGMIDIPNIARTTTLPGVVLIGDAGLASDPVWGNGCAWALRSANWLVDTTAKALAAGDGAALEQATTKFQAQRWERLGDRYLTFCDFATARRLTLLERLMYAAAVRDPQLARFAGPYLSGLKNLVRQSPPVKILAYAAWLCLTGRQPATSDEPRRHRDPSGQIPVMGFK